MQNTPLCDDQALTLIVTDSNDGPYQEVLKTVHGEYVPIEFARKLEREVVSLKGTIAYLMKD